MSAPCECEEGLPEWIMSYADMITILMAFFVVMYSMAGTPDKMKEQAVFKSLREQFGPLIPGWTAMGRGPFQRNDSQISMLQGSGTAAMRNRNKGGADNRAPNGDHPRVHSLHPGEQAATGGVVYFSEGSSHLTREQEKQLQVIAEEFNGKPQKIEVRGHTSRRPLPAGAPYRDNWDLAYSRCRETMEFLASLGIDPKRFRLSVAAENEPVGTSDALQRGLNSRVEVYLLNEVVEGAARPRSSKLSVPATDGETQSSAATPVQ